MQEKRASSAAMMKSAANAMLSPMPTQAPCTEAITGFSVL